MWGHCTEDFDWFSPLQSRCTWACCPYFYLFDIVIIIVAVIGNAWWQSLNSDTDTHTRKLLVWQPECILRAPFAAKCHIYMRCKVHGGQGGTQLLISALLDPLAAQRAISSIATEWVISALFQSQEARGLPRGLARGRGVCAALWKPQEAGRPCCKGPHQVMCAAFYASCSKGNCMQWWRKVMVMIITIIMLYQATCLFEHSFDLHSLLDPWDTFWPLVRSHLLKLLKLI